MMQSLETPESKTFLFVPKTLCHSKLIIELPHKIPSVSLLTESGPFVHDFVHQTHVHSSINSFSASTAATELPFD